MNNQATKIIYAVLFVLIYSVQLPGQHSIAREWNEILLDNIRGDNARPTVHARNLYHCSAAMYDLWAVYNEYAEPLFLGKTNHGFEIPFTSVPQPADVNEASKEAISYAMYRIMRHRFALAPDVFNIINRMNIKMQELGYPVNEYSENYETDGPHALGNYLGNKIIEFGMQDGSNEDINYGNTFYTPSNPPLVMAFPGNPDMVDPNKWQQLTLDLFIDQSGNPIPFNTPPFLSPEWGSVAPYAMTTDDLTILQRDNQDYWVYHDPGPPPYLEPDGSGMSDEYKWGFSLVSVWSSHLDPDDPTTIDISPASIGNIESYPTEFEDYPDFYNLFDGGDASRGHDLNPFTGQPYAQQMVKRADYARILAEFWADGPDSETPPGHWFTILNYVNDHPEFERKYKGMGDVLDPLEWDVKAYLMMGGAMHDCAISAWGIKGFYDYPRPVSTIRYMADQGQSSDPMLPSYSAEGIPLIPGYIELVEAGDPLTIIEPENEGKIKLYAWRGPDFIMDPEVDAAGVDWILAENWWPYQRPTFVTPPFAGYLSGHSTYSSAAAEIMEIITGDAFFPGGMGEFLAVQNEFLVFEEGPTEDITLQWATYKDASEQTSLSRIWGGIHPPADDLKGRLIGTEIAKDVYSFSEILFFKDDDQDGFFYFEDCDDNNANINPDIPETCNSIDDDCNGIIDDGLPLFTYYQDIDGDGFGDINMPMDTCQSFPPVGFVVDNTDCVDMDFDINSDIDEICDGIDNNCSGAIDDNIPYYDYYLDEDGDGFGNADISINICYDTPPEGYVTDSTDCDDASAATYPGAPEVADNGIDEDCSGVDYYKATKFFPNPVSQMLTIHFETTALTERMELYTMDGKHAKTVEVPFGNNEGFMDVSELASGIYYLRMFDSTDEQIVIYRLAKI